MKVLAFPKSSDRNPYTELLFTNMEKLGVEVVDFDPRMGSLMKADVLHVHWPEWFLGRRNPLAVWRHYSQWMNALRALKSHGTKVVWTAHNLHSHEPKHELLQSKFWGEFIPMVDGCICLSSVSRPLLREAYPSLKCPTAVVPHGHYRDVYPATLSRAEARQRLGLDADAFVFVHVGMVREYKNVPELVQAFRGTSGGHLLVAGEVFDEGLKRRVETAANGDDRVKTKLRRIEDDVLQEYFRAADIAVFPYKDILNSGSALMALSFDTPILVPAIGSMPELAEQVGSDWVRTYEGAFSASELEDAKRWVQETERGPRAPLDSLDWLPLARETVAFYREVLAMPGRPTAPVS